MPSRKETVNAYRVCLVFYLQSQPGHSPPPQQDGDGISHAPVPHKFADAFAALTPKTENSFTKFVLSHCGQGIIFSEDNTNSSNLWPHFLHKNSKIGMIQPFRFLFYLFKCTGSQAPVNYDILTGNKKNKTCMVLTSHWAPLRIFFPGKLNKL